MLPFDMSILCEPCISWRAACLLSRRYRLLQSRCAFPLHPECYRATVSCRLMD